jgi:hypothetical protein
MGYFPRLVAAVDLWAPPVVEAAIGGYGGRESAGDEAQIHRDHWEYLDGLRQVEVQVADDVAGVRTYRIPADMALPEDLVARAMRGRVRPGYQPTVADALHDPAILAALVLLIDEADE